MDQGIAPDDLQQPRTARSLGHGLCLPDGNVAEPREKGKDQRQLYFTDSKGETSVLTLSTLVHAVNSNDHVSYKP